MFNPLFYAIQLLTRLPVPSGGRILSAHEQGQSVLYYPLVGLLIGIMLAATALIFRSVEPLLQAALVLVVWVAVTGGLHIDGLADVADAWIGGQGDRERTLEIMKDPTCGPMAVIAVMLLLVVKLAALVTILSQHSWGTLLLVPMIGRTALVAALMSLPYIRPAGLGAVLAANLPIQQGNWVLLAQLLLGCIFWGWDVVWVIGLAFVLFYFLRKAFLARLGGLTGDAAGTICEMTEVVVLVVAAMLI